MNKTSLLNMVDGQELADATSMPDELNYLFGKETIQSEESLKEEELEWIYQVCKNKFGDKIQQTPK